jgi:hypothetical protein
MPSVDLLHPRQLVRYAVTLEAMEGGVNPRTTVTSRLWGLRGLHERREVFETLDEALVYARELYRAA